MVTTQHASRSEDSECQHGWNALLCSRVSVLEVQITGIPKVSMLEVASTA
jgi:hypothetical protein